MDRRGNLAVDGRLAAVFVFDGLLATCEQPRYERRAVKQRDWEKAIDAWTWQYKVIDYMYNLMSRYDVPVEVITWHSHGFALALNDRLCDMGMPIRGVTGGEYDRLSQLIAVDKDVSIVYDADPAHRFGYGFKCQGVPNG